MKKTLVLAAALLAAGVPALAESRLPADWDQKVAAHLGDAARAKQVVAAARAFDAQWQASGETMRRADAELKAAFAARSSSVGDRQLALSLFRDDRRKAAISAVDAMLKVRDLVSKKEWKGLWPEGYFVTAKPEPRLAERLPQELPSVVTDPARLKQAQAVASELAKATKSDVSAGKKARGRLEDLFADYDTLQDDFIELVNKLNVEQEKQDRAVVDAAGKLQQILTPEEWGSLTKQLAPAN
jgi:hypothetical protein